MQPLRYQMLSAENRKEMIQEIAMGLKTLNKNKFPKLISQTRSGNNKKNEVIERVITQMYSNNFDLNASFLAIEDNI